MYCQSPLVFNSVHISGSKVLINGKEVPIPDSVQKQLQNGISLLRVANAKIYLNGFEYLGNGEWRKNIISLVHKYF